MNKLKKIMKEYFNEDLVSVKILEKGFSVDKKYIVNDKYIIREIDPSRNERFRFVFDTQKLFNKTGTAQKALKFIEGNQVSYYITEYLEGLDGLEIIESLSIEQQYRLGYQTGKEIALFHLSNIQKGEKAKDSVLNYMTSKIKLAREECLEKDINVLEDIIHVVEDNIHLLFELDIYLCHSDYHLFNMIFNKGEYQGVIDFERVKYSHLFTDFRNNTPHNAPISNHFASGSIDGYLEVNYIEDFFIKYNLNDLLLSIYAIGWIKEFDSENVDKKIAFITDLYRDIKDLRVIPKWYVGVQSIK